MSLYPYRITEVYDFSTNKSLEEYHLQPYMSHMGKISPKLENGILTLSEHTAVIIKALPLIVGNKYRIVLKNASGNVVFSQNNSRYFGFMENLKNEDVNVEWQIEPNIYADGVKEKLYIHAGSTTLSFSGYEIGEWVD
ncbi:hypothetical protein QE197_25090 (plasmid) [Arsenophonus nasoniae]|uniref:Uncharacterized protein n=1 Tax=Arsenophonus nasoniae TaxID=638 RepID=A0A4P7L0G6_9GAMM|nr:hypothetical protein [Arsenophonus nasoniae]QBY45916.1 hypothetical protein ArsFIN_45270 [Arsenophonus nasoniae]QBY46010.1 hypothetical protein ArsFIN_46210 [Arsenophonus nasoniae]WGM08527.1 hypothetical protein QE258_24280 [Arsenophonus nasoniae]WGM13593.1 hypothetical protein QE197_24395 [Arsenophonus nasoniae]WGM13789.1 hypothetical protein QE197_25090 [Arsenophonus nasoniae]